MLWLYNLQLSAPAWHKAACPLNRKVSHGLWHALRKTLLLRLLLTLCCAGLTLGQARTLLMLHSPRLQVLYDDAAQEPYAQQVAAQGERALDILVPLFGFQPSRISIRIDSHSDRYRAFAPPLPRPRISIPDHFPLDADAGYRSEDLLFTLLLHELTHSVQLTYNLRLDADTTELVQAAEPSLLTRNLASVPPSWLLEGIATWAESFSGGGRHRDALTTGILDSVVLAGRAPSLTEVSLINYAPWPGNLTRYLFGGAFLDYLIDRYGFEALLQTLRQYNSGGLIGGFLQDFSSAWQRQQGTVLEDEWQQWLDILRQRAEDRAQQAYEGSLQSASHGLTRSFRFSPNGQRAAWIVSGGIIIADVHQDALRNARLLSNRAPGQLRWLDNEHLVYARVQPRLNSEFSELFIMDIASGHEQRLSHNARAQLADGDARGCILFVRDVGSEPARLQRWCPSPAALAGAEAYSYWNVADSVSVLEGQIETLWQSPAGVHILGLAVSAQGQLALSLWQGGYGSLALLEPADAAHDLDSAVSSEHLTLRTLLRERAQVLAPSWQGETRLLFHSDLHIPHSAYTYYQPDAQGVFDLYVYDQGLSSGQLQRLSRSSAGAFAPVAHPRSGALWYLALGAQGYNLAWLEQPLAEAVDVPLEPVSTVPVASLAIPVQRYNPVPSLAPYAVLPNNIALGVRRWQPLRFDAGLGLSFLGQDRSNLHSYRFSVAYDNRLTGHADGFYASLRYRYAANTILTAFDRPHAYSLTVDAGSWPHEPHRGSRQETALGLRLVQELRWPQDRRLAYVRLETSLIDLQSRRDGWQFDGRLDALLTSQPADIWGYRLSGWRFGLSSLWSATPEQPSVGVWGDVSYIQPLSLVGQGGVLELSSRVGYRPGALVPLLAIPDYSANLNLGYRFSVATPLRYGDGLYALERISISPRLRAWLAADGEQSQVFLGSDLTLALDGILNYGAPASISASIGYSNHFWTRIGLRLPL